MWVRKSNSKLAPQLADTVRLKQKLQQLEFLQQNDKRKGKNRQVERTRRHRVDQQLNKLNKYFQLVAYEDSVVTFCDFLHFNIF